MPKAIDTEVFEQVINLAIAAGKHVAIPTRHEWAHQCDPSTRRLLIDGWLYDVHHLHAAYRFRRRNRLYTMSNIVSSTVRSVEGHVFFITANDHCDVLVVPSDELASLFDGYHRPERSVCIALDGSPGRTFNFWRYLNAWPPPKLLAAQ